MKKNYNCLLQLQGHAPQPEQHIEPLTNIAKLINPDIPTIHTSGIIIPGIMPIKTVNAS